MNSFGDIFKITTWGESHGPAMGVVIDGCPSGLVINEDELSNYLIKNDRPIPEIATKRKEKNRVEFLSGVNRGKTIGTPISILIKNNDVKKKDYKKIKTVFRPGHGDYTYFKKYNITNITGGGRASGRECITRIAAGYIAEKIIKHFYNKFEVKTKLIDIAGIKITDEFSKLNAINKAKKIGKLNDSTGGKLKITISGIPAGIGEPVFDGIDAKIAGALMSIGSVKSVSIGSGGESSNYFGSQFNDDFKIVNDEISFVSNNNGGTLAGITNGHKLEIILTVKPTPSINITKTGATEDNKIQKIKINGRHDINITPRIAPIAKAMICLVIIDNLMICGRICKDRI
jgi:chorismate synthase